MKVKILTKQGKILVDIKTNVSCYEHILAKVEVVFVARKRLCQYQLTLNLAFYITFYMENSIWSGVGYHKIKWTFWILHFFNSILDWSQMAKTIIVLNRMI